LFRLHLLEKFEDFQLFKLPQTTTLQIVTNCPSKDYLKTEILLKLSKFQFNPSARNYYLRKILVLAYKNQ